MNAVTIARGAVAIVCATALWLSVSVDQTATAWVPVALSLSMDSTMALVAPPPPLRAYVVGRRADLVRLVRSPVTLRHAIASPILVGASSGDVTVDVRPTELEMPPGVEARVRDVDPRVIVLRVARR